MTNRLLAMPNGAQLKSLKPLGSRLGLVTLRLCLSSEEEEMRGFDRPEKLKAAVMKPPKRGAAAPPAGPLYQVNPDLSQLNPNLSQFNPELSQFNPKLLPESHPLQCPCPLARRGRAVVACSRPRGCTASPVRKRLTAN